MVSGLEEALVALEGSGVVAFPTETVWGIGCRLDRPEGIERIFTLKQRTPDKPLQVLLAAPDAIGSVAVISPEAAALARRFMPGPIMIVLPGLASLPDLGAGEATVGVRIPDHPVALALLERAGPMAATSANLSGEPTPDDGAGVREVFGDEIDAYVDGPPPPLGVPSTAVDLSGDVPRLLRDGAVTRAAVEDVLGCPLAEAP